jgi:hypothetical protein
MKLSQDIRDKGMKDMSDKFKEMGGKVYVEKE